MTTKAVYGQTSIRTAGIAGILASPFSLPRQVVIGAILIMALLAFEMFNFDTTQYALRSLLGDVRFVGLGWATILAVAFCAIDFAGLARLFTPQRGSDEPKEVWYLMGAWLLGATMNALMTWWAVSLTLLNHELGNEVMSREQLLTVVPIFVAVLVWLTRILFIGAVTVAGERFLNARSYLSSEPKVASQPSSGAGSRYGRTPNGGRAKEAPSPKKPIDLTSPHRQSNPDANGRIRHRPPRPTPTGNRRIPASAMRSSSYRKKGRS